MLDWLVGTNSGKLVEFLFSGKSKRPSQRVENRVVLIDLDHRSILCITKIPSEKPNAKHDTPKPTISSVT
jgi:hypothetical protein